MDPLILMGCVLRTTSSVKRGKGQINTGVRIVKSEINTRGHKTVMNIFAAVS